MPSLLHSAPKIKTPKGVIFQPSVPAWWCLPDTDRSPAESFHSEIKDTSTTHQVSGILTQESAFLFISHGCSISL